MQETLGKILYSDFAWGFYDIKTHAKAWWNMISYSNNSESMADWSYRWFNDMVTSVQRYVDGYPDVWSYDQDDRAGYL